MDVLLEVRDRVDTTVREPQTRRLREPLDEFARRLQIKELSDVKEQPGDTVGFHGTSLDAVQIMMQTGYLPTGVGEMNEGAIYFNPLPSTLRASNWKCDLPRSEQDAIENAKDYAGLLGRGHWVAHRAGAQDFNSAVSVCREAIVVESTIRDFPKHFGEEWSRSGLDQSTLCHFISQSSSVKGVLLYLNPTVYHDFRVCEAISGDQGFRIMAPEGLPLRCISGIVPLGAYEKDFFKSFGNSCQS